MSRRPPTPIDELYRRAVAYVDRRGGALIRRGGRSGGGGWGRKRFGVGELYGLSQFSAANWYQTQAGGGEAGVGTGFLVFALFRARAKTGNTQGITGNWGAAHTTGYLQRIDGTTANNVWISNISGSNITPASIVFVPSDYGRIHLVANQVAPGSVVQTIDRALRTSVAAIGANYSPPVGTAQSMGNWLASLATYGADGTDILSMLAVRGVPSDEQLRTLFDQTRTLGDLPSAFPLGSATDADIAALAPRHWYRMDTFTEGGGNLAGLQNRNATVGGQLAVTAGTIALPAADAAMNGMPSIAFTGTQRLVSDLAPDEFGFMHRTGWLFLVFINTASDATDRYLLSTANAIAANVGIAVVLRGPASSNAGVYVGSGTNLSYLDPIPNTPAGQAICLAVKLSGTPQAGQLPNLSNFAAVFPFSPSAPTRTLTIGSNSGAPTAVLRLADVVAFDRDMSASEVQKFSDYIRVRYGIGQITTTHRWSLRDVLRAQNRRIVDNELAPASLPDTVTQAAIDRMDRQGSPVVRVIDASVDGRKSYGAMGFSAASVLQTVSASGGIRGANQFWIAVEFTPWSITGATQGLVVVSENGGQGYQLYVNGATIGVTVRDSTSNKAVSSASVIASGDIGIPQIAILNYDGAKVDAYYKGVVVATVAASGYTPWNQPMRLGNRTDGGISAVFMAISRVQGADGSSLSASDIGSLYTALAQRASIPRLSSAQHDYDVTQDIIANGGPSAGFPAQVQDRIGTDHLTRVGGLQVSAGPPAGLTGASAAQVLQTLSSAPILNTAQWFVAMDVLLGDYGADGLTHYLLSKSNTTTLGLEIRIQSGGIIDVAYGTGSARSAVTSLVLSADEKTTRIRFLVQYDSTGTVTTLYVGSAARTATSAAVTYAAASNPLTICTFGVGGANSNGLAVVYGVQCGNALLTPAERDALLADTTFAAVPGKTTFRHWFPDDISAAGGKVPAVTKDRVGSTDMVTVGSPLQVASRTERLWSYETQPLLYGTGGHTISSKYTASAGGGGNVLAFGGTLIWRPRAGAASATRVLLSALLAGPNRGWDVRTTGANASISMMFSNAANGNVSSGIAALTAALDKVCVFSWQWDGVTNKLFTYLNRAAVAPTGGTTIVGYAPSTGALSWGAELTGTTAPGTDSELFGLVMWEGSSTLAQVQSQHDAIMANDGRPQQMPGASNTMLIDVTVDTQANGGALPPTFTNRLGANYFTREGSPVLASQYARAFGW